MNFILKRLYVAAVLVAVTAAPVALPRAPKVQAASPTNDTNVPTGSADSMRTGWYPNEPGLSPQVVGSSNFGQLFSTPINGQVYAQPLLVNGTVLVATETNWLYGLDPVTGGVQWSR